VAVGLSDPRPWPRGRNPCNGPLETQRMGIPDRRRKRLAGTPLVLLGSCFQLRGTGRFI
jgi:hypothetical protein